MNITGNSGVLIDSPSATHEISVSVEDVVRHVAIVVRRLAVALAIVQGQRNWIVTICLSEKKEINFLFCSFVASRSNSE